MSFIKEEDGIFRLTLPFEELYTTVFALTDGKGWIVCDAGTTEQDVNDIILPALQELNAVPNYIFCSHRHADHAGGLPTLSKAFPNAIPINSPTVLLSRFEAVSLKGHSEDSLAILDKKTRTLLSFDCLQQRGIGKYRSGVDDIEAYKASIEWVQGADIERIIFSHDYDPCGYSVKGRDEIENALDICKEVIKS